MIETPLYLKNGSMLAHSYLRVVHGGRGDYIELTTGNFELPLFYKGTHMPFDEQTADMNAPFYYHWLVPYGHDDVKVYFQLKTVKYADYQIGHYYISPDMLNGFVDDGGMNLF